MLYYPFHKKIYDPLRFGLPNPRDIVFQTEDGIDLHGWYFDSPTKPAKALVVHFHGNAENITSHFLGSAWLVKEGYDVFIFDYRGYGLSKGKPTPAGTVKDGKAALKWAAEQNPQLIVWGQSLGGAIAQRTLIETRGQYAVAGAVFESTFSSYQSVGRSLMAKGWLTWLFQPLAYLLLSDRHAPGAKVGELAPMPVLVVHGTADRVVDIKQGRQVLACAREPKEMWEIEGAGHIGAFWVGNGTHRPRLKSRFDEWVKAAKR